MDVVRSRVTGFVGKKDNLVNLFLGVAVVALGFRSSEQQREIEALEAEKSSLRTANKAMATAMWDWRQHFFQLAETDPSAAPIPIARLRAIYGEEEPPLPRQDLLPDAAEESIHIS